MGGVTSQKFCRLRHIDVVETVHLRRLLPFPLLSAALLLLWLLLNQTISPNHLLLASAVGLVGGWTLAALQLPKLRLRRLATILRLVGIVTSDIVRSNIAVARIVLGFGRAHRTSGFVNIPLDVRDPYGLAALACIITSTPGTLWVSFDEKAGILTIHVFDLVDESDWFRKIKGDYERLLLEIFA
jgi:multicomponent K+:H+ antiporter subunit E